MHTKHNFIKSMGPKAATVVTTLSSTGSSVFHTKDAIQIAGKRAAASKVLTQLTKNGVVTRLKSGTYRIVPYDLGFESEYLGNQYLVARELVTKGLRDIQYYLSHGSAFDLHQMVTQPQLVVYVSSPKMIRTQTILGTEFKFIRCKKEHLFGITEMWIDKNEKILISDLERTLLDCLKQPNYCGGFIEVAKAFSIKRDLIDTQKLIDYAIQLDVGAVFRRLGYLMEIYNIGDKIHLQFLQTKLTATYQLLDPNLPAEGSHTAKWRLRLNISEEELIAIRGI